MRLWISRKKEGVVGYQSFGRYRVASGEPVCPPGTEDAIAREFEKESSTHGKKVCYFAGEGASANSPYSVVIGSQPVWNPGEWSGILAKTPSLRAQINRARNKGVTVETWGTGISLSGEESLHARLRPVLREWLSTRRMLPLHFLVEPDLLQNLEDRRVFVALKQGRPLAYLIATPIPARQGWLIEQIVRGRQAPNGTSELLVDAAMCAAQDEGREYLTLGLVPLARYSAESRERNPWWVRLAFAWMREHATRFYNFKGLESFKVKFRPTHWEPVYARIANSPFRPGALYAIAGVFGGMAPPRFVALSLKLALRMELRWMLYRLRIIFFPKPLKEETPCPPSDSKASPYRPKPIFTSMVR